MCVIFIAWQQDPEWPLILLSNRDEFHQRASRPAHYWDEPDVGRKILGGIDLVANGSWLALSDTGKFAAVTNFRQGKNATNAGRSRGDLVRNFLTSESSAEEYVQQIQQGASVYNAFNLLTADAGSLFWQSSEHNFGQAEKLAPGIYGLSNALLNTPWPKVKRGKAELQALLVKGFSVEAAFALLADTQQADVAELPDTGVGQAFEQMLSPIFIQSLNYGTRFSTVVCKHRSGNMSFAERSFGPNGHLLAEQQFKLKGKIESS